MKRITLTFDNGPHLDGTPHLLETLAARSLKATFFVVGEKLRHAELRELAVRAKARGHRIANHTHTHGVPLGRRPGKHVAEEEIGQAQQLLEGLAIEKLFRPNGDKGRLGEHMLSEDAVSYLEAHQFTAVSWNCVPQDWVMPPESWVERAQKIMLKQDWTVLVVHDHCLDSMKYLGGFLDALIAQGYEFSQEFPVDCVLIDRGRRTDALIGRYTPGAATSVSQPLASDAAY